MPSRTPDARDVLKFRPREDYLDSPLPSVRDDQITEFTASLLDEESVDHAAGAIATTPETVLGPYIQRAAALAVRQAAPRFIHAGLRAAALMAVDGDPRDVAVALALLWRSAERLLLDPSEEFTKVGRSLGRHGTALHAFVRRDPDSRTVRAMRYAEVGEGADFRYESRW